MSIPYTLCPQACDVIVDDILYFEQSWYSPDPIAQAVEAVYGLGANYFTAVLRLLGRWQGCD